MKKETIHPLNKKVVFALVVIFLAINFIILRGEFIKPGTIDYPDASIFYEYDDQIFQFYPDTCIKRKIANGIAPMVSHDGTKVAYGYYSNNRHFKQDVDSSGIYILEVKSGNRRLLLRRNGWGDFCENWSPDDRHLLMEIDCDVGGTEKAVIDTSTGKIGIKFFSNSIFPSVWVNEKEIVYTEKQEISPRIPIGTGRGDGIASIDLYGNEKVLLRSTSKKMYHFLGLLDNGEIYFEQSTVLVIEHWDHEFTQFNSYFTMDKKGKISTTGKIRPLSDQIRRILPRPYRNYKYIGHCTPLQSNKNWVIFVLNKHDDKNKNKLEDEIFIMNICSPNSIKKITEGTHPSWVCSQKRSSK